MGDAERAAAGENQRDAGAGGVIRGTGLVLGKGRGRGQTR
jgi:hypothetical protein